MIGGVFLFADAIGEYGNQFVIKLLNCLADCSRVDVYCDGTTLKTGSPQVTHFP